MIRRVESPAFEESVRLLLTLHELIAEGKGDDAEADDVREQMDTPWYEMTRTEKDLVNELSADLYTIGQQPASATPISQNKLRDDEFNAAALEENWPKILTLVREQQQLLSPDAAAFIRGVAWMHLGHPEVALRFFREVERLRPLSDTEIIWLLTCLMQTERLEDTLQAANRFAKSVNALVRLRASNALSLAAQRLSDGARAGTRDRAIAIAEEALAKVESVSNDDRTAELLWQSSLFQLALDYEESGETAKAIHICNQILEKQPNSFDAQMLFDWLTYGQNPDQARERFWQRFRDRLPQRAARELPSLVLTSAK